MEIFDPLGPLALPADLGVPGAPGLCHGGRPGPGAAWPFSGLEVGTQARRGRSAAPGCISSNASNRVQQHAASSSRCTPVLRQAGHAVSATDARAAPLRPQRTRRRYGGLLHCEAVSRSYLRLGMSSCLHLPSGQIHQGRAAARPKPQQAECGARDTGPLGRPSGDRCSGIRPTTPGPMSEEGGGRREEEEEEEEREPGRRGDHEMGCCIPAAGLWLSASGAAPLRAPRGRRLTRALAGRRPPGEELRAARAPRGASRGPRVHGVAGGL
ncbi:unnamed protein product, partial [Prorocentrum cordatum]